MGIHPSFLKKTILLKDNGTYGINMLRSMDSFTHMMLALSVSEQLTSKEVFSSDAMMRILQQYNEEIVPFVTLSQIRAISAFKLSEYRRIQEKLADELKARESQAMLTQEQQNLISSVEQYLSQSINVSELQKKFSEIEAGVHREAHPFFSWVNVTMFSERTEPPPVLPRKNSDALVQPLTALASLLTQKIDEMNCQLEDISSIHVEAIIDESIPESPKAEEALASLLAVTETEQSASVASD